MQPGGFSGKVFRMKLPLALALLFAFSIPDVVNGQDPYGPPLTGERLESGRRRVTKTLSEDKIHRVELNKAPIREAVDFWIKETKKGGAGWNLVLKLGDEAGSAPPEKVPEVPKLVDIPELHAMLSAPVPSRAREPLITIHRENMSSRDFLDEVCQQAGLKWTIELWEKWGFISILPKPK